MEYLVMKWVDGELKKLGLGLGVINEYLDDNNQSKFRLVTMLTSFGCFMEDLVTGWPDIVGVSNDNLHCQVCIWRKVRDCMVLLVVLSFGTAPGGLLSWDIYFPLCPLSVICIPVLNLDIQQKKKILTKRTSCFKTSVGRCYLRKVRKH